MLQSYPLPLTVDKERLEKTLEGMDYPEHYFELVCRTCRAEKLFSGISFKLFLAARPIFKTDIYTLARVYVGTDIVSPEQEKAIRKLYIEDVVVEYTLVRGNVSLPQRRMP